jgi:hypothetical protein
MNEPPGFAAIGITEGESVVLSKARYECLLWALQFAHDIASEELPFAKVGTGAEVALRHIKRKTGEALEAV